MVNQGLLEEMAPLVSRDLEELMVNQDNLVLRV